MRNLRVEPERLKFLAIDLTNISRALKLDTARLNYELGH
jgi:hypothetical protein